jgi:hypothetical protein
MVLPRLSIEMHHPGRESVGAAARRETSTAAEAEAIAVGIEMISADEWDALHAMAVSDW